MGELAPPGDLSVFFRVRLGCCLYLSCLMHNKVTRKAEELKAVFLLSLSLPLYCIIGPARKSRGSALCLACAVFARSHACYRFAGTAASRHPPGAPSRAPFLERQGAHVPVAAAVIVIGKLLRCHRPSQIYCGAVCASIVTEKIPSPNPPRRCVCCCWPSAASARDGDVDVYGPYCSLSFFWLAPDARSPLVCSGTPARSPDQCTHKYVRIRKGCT